jgi:hypothetical protein
MSIVILAVIALADYVITVYCILSVLPNPTFKAGEGDQATDNSVIGHIKDDKEFYDYIEEQNIRIARLSSNIEKIISNIDAIIEKDKEERGILSG